MKNVDDDLRQKGKIKILIEKAKKKNPKGDIKNV